MTRGVRKAREGCVLGLKRDRQAEDVQNFMRRLRPMIRGLLRCAHAMAGNADRAEDLLIAALLDAFARRGEWRERMSFREGTMRALYAAAIAPRDESPCCDGDWTGFSAGQGGADPLVELLAGESVPTQRLMALRFGCGLTAREIARLTGARADAVRDQLLLCQLRLEKALGRERISVKPFDRAATRAIRRSLNADDGQALDVGYVFRCFERGAREARESRHIAGRMVRALLYAAGMLLFALLFWVLAILME